MEEWREIKNYEGLYSVSNKGRVRSEYRAVQQWNGHCVCTKIVKEKIRKLFSNGLGYLQVPLNKEGDVKKFYVHRLVIEAFNGTVKEGFEVNHIDHDKANNDISNLEEVTKAENHRKRIIFYDNVVDNSICSCGDKKRYESKQCKSCDVIDRRVDLCLSRPSLGTLLKDVYSIGYEATGRKYKVSGNSIKRWIISWHKIM